MANSSGSFLAGVLEAGVFEDIAPDGWRVLKSVDDAGALLERLEVRADMYDEALVDDLHDRLDAWRARQPRGGLRVIAGTLSTSEPTASSRKHPRPKLVSGPKRKRG